MLTKWEYKKIAIDVVEETKTEQDALVSARLDAEGALGWECFAIQERGSIFLAIGQRGQEVQRTLLWFKRHADR